MQLSLKQATTEEAIAEAKNVRPLPLEAFLAEMADIPPHELKIAQFHNLVARLQLSDAFLEKFILFKSDRYFYKSVARNDAVEIITCCWMPGQKSGIHAHTGTALNVTRVLRGTITEELYEIAGEDILLFRATELSKGGFATTERYQFHQLANNSGDKVVTLHVYTPARPN